MPLGITPSDRNLLLIVGAIFLLMLVTGVLLSPAPEEMMSPVPSTYSAQPDGAEAAYLLLSRLQFPVRRWLDRPADLPEDPNGVLLILAEPTETPTDKEEEALAKFVEDGGHVLFTGPGITTFFPNGGTSQPRLNPSAAQFSPTIPSYLARGARQITMRPKAYWKNLSGVRFPLYGEPDSPVVIAWKVGAGEIVWWADSMPLNNGGIRQADNLTFFLNTVSNPRSNRPYRIYWDEYFHGERNSLWSYVEKTSLRWGFAQLGLLGVAIAFTFSRRSGPIFQPHRVSRLSPLEFVDTLGGLYERAGAASSAVSISRMRLRSLLARQLGLPNDVPDADLARATETRLGWKDSGLAELLARAAAASRAEKLRPVEGLDLVQNLERFAGRLDLRHLSGQENK
jgi:hypothetical protein